MNKETRRPIEIVGISSWAQDKGETERERGSERLPPCSVTKNVKVIFEEFQSLYEERLKRLKCGAEGCSQEEMLQRKVRILQSYVKDLCDQNQLLVQTVEDLERESRERVTSLERELRISDKTIKDLNHQRRRLEESCDRLHAENLELKTDMDTLAQAVQRAQRTHGLDMTRVKLQSVSLERVLQPAATDHEGQEGVMAPLRHVLPEGLQAGRGLTINLQEEMKTLSDKTAPKANEPQEKTDAPISLRRGRLESLEKLRAGKVAEMADRDVTIARHGSQLGQARQDGADMQSQTGGQLAWERGVLLEDHRGEAEEREEHGKKMSEELAVLKQNHAAARQEVGRLERVVQEQAEALGRLQRRHQERVEESGRLQARLEAQTLTAQSQQDALNTEIRNTENTLHKLQQRLSDREDVLERTSQKMLALEQELEEVRARYSAARQELCGQCDLVGALERRLEQATAAQKEASCEVSDREERLAHLQLELSSVLASQEHTRRALALKEQLHAQISQENRLLRENVGSLQNQLQASEEKVNSLGLEVGTLKSKLQEKTEQSQQLQDQILQQQEALSRAGETLKETRKAAGNKIQRKDNKLSTLQKQLQDLKKQHSDCKKEHESTVQRLQEDAAELAAQTQQRSQDLGHLSAERSRLELELAVVGEKHRTAQREVSCRDQVILHMKTELKAVEERHRGAQEELVALEAEVSRLNEVVSGQCEQLGEAEQSCRHAHLRLQQEQQDKQKTHSHLHSTQLQLKSQAESLSALRSELEALKQNHSADEQRWSQKTSLLQGQLGETHAHLREASAQARQQRHALKKLKSQASQAQTQLQHAQDKVKEEEERVRTLKGELASLRGEHEGAQQRLEAVVASAQSQEATAAISRQKYTVAMEKVQQLQEQLQACEEEVRYSRQQVLEAQGVISNLREENGSLEARGEEKRRQADRADEAIDHLTDELQAALDALTASREQVCDRDRVIEKLRADVDDRQAKITDYERRCLQLQGDLIAYQLSHSHPNNDYEAQRRQRDLYLKEVTLLRHQYEEHAQRSMENDRLLAQLHEEAQGLRAELQRGAQEKQEQERAAQSLQLDLAAAHREHGAALSALQQELSLARDASAHKDQAIQQRDKLLQRAEADLQQAQEAIRTASQEAEGLREEVHSARQETCSQQLEKQALNTHISRLNQQLQTAQGLYKSMAQALAGQEERVGLLESGLRSAEERLSERAAHGGHRSRSQLGHVQEMVVRLQEEAVVAQSSLQQALEDAMQQQRHTHTLTVEREHAAEGIHTLTQQLQQQAGQMCSLRLELQQKRSLCQDQQQEVAQLRGSVTHLSTQVESLRQQRDSHANTVKRQDARVCELGMQLQQCQAACQERSVELQGREEQLRALRAEMDALQQRLQRKEEEAEAVKQEQRALERKLEEASSELQRLGETLEEAQAENSHLSQEGQLVLTNVSHWIKEQKRASEKLSERVKDQSRQITILTTERDHLQMSRDVLEGELKTLRAASEERERELERLKALHSHSDHQQALLNQLQGQLEEEEIERENLVTNNLNQLSDMQEKLRSNMDSILHLNQQLCALSAERDEQHTQLVRERARRKQMELQLLKEASADPHPHPHPHPPPGLQHLQRCLSHGSLQLTSDPRRQAGPEAEGWRDPGEARLWRCRSAQRLEDPWVLLTGGRPSPRPDRKPTTASAPHLTQGQGQVSTKVVTC